MGIKLREGVNPEKLRDFGFLLGKEWADKGERCLAGSGYEYQHNRYHKFSMNPDNPNKILYADSEYDYAMVHISYIPESNTFFVDLAPSCTYHICGDEVDIVLETFYDLAKAGLVEKESEGKMLQMNQAGNIRIESVINDLIFIREKLHNGIFGEKSTPALTEAICLLGDLQELKMGMVLSKESVEVAERENILDALRDKLKDTDELAFTHYERDLIIQAIIESPVDVPKDLRVKLHSYLRGGANE